MGIWEKQETFGGRAKEARKNVLLGDTSQGGRWHGYRARVGWEAEGGLVLAWEQEEFGTEE